ncbi:MAG: hypothetical protein LQ351_007019 [Letrouitia transgressa]|nr:MAG: hypothetical protein LQ351_007019 [Letrouitia transgressa]
MVESMSSNNTIDFSSPPASSSLDSTLEQRQLPTVVEHKRSFASSHKVKHSTVNERRPSSHRSRSRDSEEPSPFEHVEQIVNKPSPRVSTRRLRRKESHPKTPERPRWSSILTSDGTPASLRSGPAQESMSGHSPQSKKPKSGGFRSTFRKLFGRKAPKNRISLPAPVAYTQHVSFVLNKQCRTSELTLQDPNQFITSAVDLAKQRSASVPTQTILRSSALGSHSPFVVQTPPDVEIRDSGVPPRPERSPPLRPERSPPLRPIRPRRVSLPSVILNAQEGKTIDGELSGLGLHNAPNNTTDNANIGYAVTSGSNPKRRSRSADNFRNTAKEHRMSPIQWRRWRRRSDEIRYWRASADGTSVELTAPESRQPSPDHTISRRQGFVESTPEMPQEAEPDTEMEEIDPGDFNFGLSSGAMQSRERIGLEERLVTLEIKLMDVEYTISKMQVDMKSPTSPTEDIAQHYSSPILPSQTHLQPPSNPQPDRSPTSNYDQSPESTPGLRQTPFETSPGMQQSPFASHFPERQPKPRPTSIATTLKPAKGDRSSRNSMTELTIEHYTTLITLIRREQSARIRLEDQVTLLQRQVDMLKSASPSSLREIRGTTHHYSSSDSHRHYSPPDERRPYSRDSNERFLRHHHDERSKSSNYDDEGTDTDDEAFHEVYVTPVERGEFERGDLEGEEGLAF